MIDFVSFVQSAGFRLAIALIALLCFGGAVLPVNLMGGFACGALAFCLAAISLEQLTRRALQLGDVRSGIKSGFLWVALKFVGPAGTIFYGIWRDFSPAGIMTGIFVSLGLFVLIIWLSQGRGAVGPKF